MKEQIQVGIKSKEFIQPGYVWAPYIPLFNTEDFKPREGIASRYSTKVVNSNYFTHICGVDPFESEIDILAREIVEIIKNGVN